MQAYFASLSSPIDHSMMTRYNDAAPMMRCSRAPGDASKIESISPRLTIPFIERRKAERGAVKAVSDEDFLVSLAGRLLPDGGMPGKDPEQRLLASALALLAFTEMAQAAGTSAFDHHIQRLSAFLKQGVTALGDDRQVLLEHLQDLAAHGHSPAGSIGLAKQHLNRPGLRPAAWDALRMLIERC